MEEQNRRKDRARAEEEDFLKDYRPEDYARPSVAVDLVIFTVLDTDLKVLLVRRRTKPFQGSWALPGGFVRVGDDQRTQGEDLNAAAHRVLAEKTGLPDDSLFLEQLYTFGRADRDPRMRVITVAYYALVRPDLAPMITAAKDPARVGWFSLSATLSTDDTDSANTASEQPDRADPTVPCPSSLAFDHDEILATALLRIRGKVDYAPLAFELVPPTFTVAELRSVYEAIKGEAYDPSNFRRRLKRMMEDGIIEQAPGKRHTASRPARVYRFNR